MGLTFDEAMRIVRWQGAFHARHWRGLSDSPPPSAFENLWARGGYWTLEKQVDDVPRIVSEWNKLVTAFPEDPTLIEHRDVGARLAAAAPAISRAANRRGAQARSVTTLVPIRPRSRGERRSLRTFPGVSLCPPIAFNPDTPRRLSTPLLTPSTPPRRSLVWTLDPQTLVHGDLKAANVIFPIHAVDASDPAAEGDPDPDPVVIDWQWVGPGAVAHDLLYFLATSLSMDALTRVDELVEAYHAELTRRLRARGHHAAADAFTATDLREDLDVHAADYLRRVLASITLVPIRPRRRGERRSLRTFSHGVCFSPPRVPRVQSRRTHLDAFQLRF
jgi:hypothetical protein